MSTLCTDTKPDEPFLLPESVTIYQITDLHKDLLKLPLKQKQTLDFAHTTEIDSSGIQLLIAFEAHCKVENCSLVFGNVSDEIVQLFRLFHCQFQITSIETKAE